MILLCAEEWIMTLLWLIASLTKSLIFIHSRIMDDVAAWLKLYPHLLIVSRDGATVYKNAVIEANPNIQHVSDRFHLLKI